MGETLADRRRRYAADITARAATFGVDDERVRAAFAAVPRERCLTPPPWEVFGGAIPFRQTTSDPALLYGDVLVALDRARGINNGQPSLHAAWMMAVSPQPGETVVQIGAGSGYYTAILAELVGPSGRVLAYEVEPGLASLARANLAGWPQAQVKAESGVGPIPDADVVYAAAAVAFPPASWLRALRPQGRMVLPWQPSAGGGITLLVRRRAVGFEARTLFGVAFIPCAGAAPDRSHRHLSPGDLARVRSAWLRAERDPDESALAVFDEVWFSSAEPG